MNDFRSQVASADRSYANADLATFFAQTYRWMSVGLAITGFVAYCVAHSPTALEMVAGNRAIFLVLLVVELGVVFAFAGMAHRVSAASAMAMYLSYAFLNGLTLSVLFLRYSQQSIGQVFFVTAGAFAGLSVYGMVTKRDLSPVGRFMMMGLFGLIIAWVVSFFFQTPAMMFVMSCIGVLVFAGLTAYDTQKLKVLYASHGASGNLALRGALTLYLDFVNLFLFLLRLFGNRRN
jgi:FtsH-binding integral membrane protein